MAKAIRVGRINIGGKKGLVLMAGLCVIESREICLELAKALVGLSRKLDIPFIFKASYDKANRTAHTSFRGPGLIRGLEILAEVKERFQVPILVDVHHETEVPPAAAVADVLQLPAFLCRQTDLVLALGESGKVVNIKKGQFLAPEDLIHVIRKVESTGNKKICLTERGSSFGYGNLVADMRSLLIMREFGYPVIFDATHSVQRPGGADGRTGGDGRWAPALARAAVATGACDGLFIETHLNPAQALSDRDNAIPFRALAPLWKQLVAIRKIAGV